MSSQHRIRFMRTILLIGKPQSYWPPSNKVIGQRKATQKGFIDRLGYSGATEIAGVDNVARAKKQGLKTREWTRRHEETGVDNAGVSDREK